MHKSITVFLRYLAFALLVLSGVFAFVYFGSTPPPEPDRSNLPPRPPARAAKTPTGPMQLNAARVGEIKITAAFARLADTTLQSRDEALAVLAQCTPVDLPAIQPFTEHANEDVRQQALFQRARLQGTVFAFQAVFPDGSPVTNAKINFQVRVAMTPEERLRTEQMQHDPDWYRPLACGGTVTTDSEGVAVAGTLANGDYVVFLGIAGPLPAQSQKMYFSLSSNQPVIRFTALRGCALTIRVVDDAGEPIAGATVLQPVSWPGNDFRTSLGLIAQVRDRPGNHLTDADGRFSFGLLPFRQVAVAAAKEGYEPAVEWRVELKDDQALEHRLTIKLTPPAQH